MQALTRLLVLYCFDYRDLNSLQYDVFCLLRKAVQWPAVVIVLSYWQSYFPQNITDHNESKRTLFFDIAQMLQIKDVISDCIGFKQVFNLNYKSGLHEKTPFRV